MQSTASHDHVLNELDIRPEPFALCALEGMCSLGLGRLPGATLHYVVGGVGELSLPEHRPIALTPGRLVLVPSCVRHSLSHQGGVAAGVPDCRPAGLDLQEHVARGEGIGKMVVLCARLEIGLRGAHGLIDLLREPMTLDLDAAPGAARAMETLIEEVTQDRTGGRAMVRVLLLQCVIEMLRGRLAAGDPDVLWLGALNDPGLWRALCVILDDPGAAHSLERLAEVAGMSRSRFAERFHAAYGQGPMRFLRGLRLARAANLLVDQRLPVKRVAQLVGFASRSAFTRAFIETWGQSPRAFRDGRAK